jgi:hypothetical protein
MPKTNVAVRGACPPEIDANHDFLKSYIVVSVAARDVGTAIALPLIAAPPQLDILAVLNHAVGINGRF